jgi:hypothetical protein
MILGYTSLCLATASKPNNDDYSTTATLSQTVVARSRMVVVTDQIDCVRVSSHDIDQIAVPYHNTIRLSLPFVLIYRIYTIES